jgi:hypothetical protein
MQRTCAQTPSIAHGTPSCMHLILATSKCTYSKYWQIAALINCGPMCVPEYLPTWYESLSMWIVVCDRFRGWILRKCESFHWCRKLSLVGTGVGTMACSRVDKRDVWSPILMQRTCAPTPSIAHGTPSCVHRILATSKCTYSKYWQIAALINCGPMCVPEYLPTWYESLSMWIVVCDWFRRWILG